jgi:hypothetical protein
MSTISNTIFTFIAVGAWPLYEFSLPEHPASRDRIRLLRRDAKWSFSWGEGWALTSDGREVLGRGTPVLLVGDHDFSSARPWLNPDWWRTPIRLPVDMFAIGAS